MGLRFFCVGGGGGSWKIAVLLLGVHTPLNKSAPDFRNASIHCLSSRQYILRRELPLSRFLGSSLPARKKLRKKMHTPSKFIGNSSRLGTIAATARASVRGDGLG
jgi:hypothetical protein